MNITWSKTCWTDTLWIYGLAMATLKTMVLHRQVTRRVLGNWGRAGGTAWAPSCRSHRQCHSQTLCRGTAPKHPRSEPALPGLSATPCCLLWLRAAINTAQQDGDPWQLQKPGESTLQQPCWCRKYEILFLGKKNLKSRNSQEKETVSMKLRWGECIGNLGTRRSFAILSVYFPCTESWFLAKKKSQIEATKKKKVSSAF